MVGSEKPQGVSIAAQLTGNNAESAWDDAGSHTLGAWDFGTDEQIPALKYANYDDAGTTFDCNAFPAACGTLLPGQTDRAEASASGPSVAEFGETVTLVASLGFGRVPIENWKWRQLAGPEVALSDVAARETTFTGPATREPLVFELTATDGDGRKYTDSISLATKVDADNDNDGLIEIYSLTDLHNMRHNLEGTSYKTGAGSAGDSSGCPRDVDGGCFGYELMQDLDFDGDGDGGTWQEDSDGGYTLDADDSQADYFLVDENGAGGWLPIGPAFAAEFDGNGHRIRNLAIRRDQASVGLFGAIDDDAAIRGLGLIDNLAYYSGSSNNDIHIGGLVGRQGGGSITASYATGPAAGGAGDNDYVGGLVGGQDGGSITASYATGAAAGGGRIDSDGDGDYVGGLVGRQSVGSITASYAAGPVAGGGGSDRVGGLVGRQEGGSITASYATGPVAGGDGEEDGRRRWRGWRVDVVGGLVGHQVDGSITASYATGAAAGGAGDDDYVGGLVGFHDGGHCRSAQI